MDEQPTNETLERAYEAVCDVEALMAHADHETDFAAAIRTVIGAYATGKATTVEEALFKCWGGEPVYIEVNTNEMFWVHKNATEDELRDCAANLVRDQLEQVRQTATLDTGYVAAREEAFFDDGRELSEPERDRVVRLAEVATVSVTVPSWPSAYTDYTPTHTLTLSADAVAVLAGLVAAADPNTAIAGETVRSEIRQAFPPQAFEDWLAGSGSRARSMPPRSPLAGRIDTYQRQCNSYDRLQQDHNSAVAESRRSEQAETPPGGERLEHAREALLEQADALIADQQELIAQLLPRCITDEAVLNELSEALNAFNLSAIDESSSTESAQRIGRLAEAARHILSTTKEN